MRISTWKAAASVAVFLSMTGCNGEKAKIDPAAAAPPPTTVEQEADASLVKADHPERFTVVAAGEYSAAPELNVTGQVMADVARTVPVISLASGRVVEVHARLGDEVKKGQLIMKVRSTDISSAFSDYRKAVADEALARAQLQRAQILNDKGAIAQKDLEIAQDVEDKAKVDVETTEERLRILGAGTNNPSGIVDIFAPISGVVIEQNVTAAAGVKTFDNSPNLFTIADLSYVWILCDVFENQLPFIRMGEYADVKMTAYPNDIMHGRISNIGPILDPTIRTAKVRLELKNPGRLRVGMFVNATFHGNRKETVATVPATAVLHLHDRDWVYTPAGDGKYRRLEVSGGDMLPNKMQQIRSGLKPGQQVVSNALILQNTVEQ